MSDANVQIPINQQTPNKAPLRPKKIDKLPPEQRKWSGNVLKALGLQPRSAQNRIFAGAIASAEMVEQNGSGGDKALARHLRGLVLKAGNPPWDLKTGMQVGSLKIELDLLSIPENQRQLRPLAQGVQGVHQAFWIDRKDADGQERHSFLCKPSSDPNDGLAPSGAPKGGEVAREALSGRAANWISGELGIDLNMPETHVVKLKPELMGQPRGADVTCSVQEARSVQGDMRDATPEVKARLDPRQIAGIAILDAMTLNTDRHSGNVMLDANNNLVPIDHGESFAEPNDEGLRRIVGSVGGPHNGLLALPGAHEPLPPDMIKKLKAMAPKKYAKSLSGERDAISDEHDSMKTAISDGAIDMAQRAARFVQLAAKTIPPMSPAAIQVAMGNAAKLLFDPQVADNAFEQTATLVLRRFAGQGEVVKQVCTSDNAEWEKLAEKATALGWQVSRRGGEPSDSLADPLILLKIVKEGVRAPNGWRQSQALLGQMMQDQPLSPDAALRAVLELRIAAVDGAIRLAAVGQQRTLAAQKSQALAGRTGQALPIDEQLRRLSGLLKVAVSAAVTAMGAQLDQWQVASHMDDLVTDNLLPYKLDAYHTARGFLGAGAPEQAKPLYDQVGIHIGQNKYILDACRATSIRLSDTADALGVPPRNAILREGFQALANGDPLLAFQKLKALKAQNRVNPCAKVQERLDKLRQEYLFEPTDNVVRSVEEEIQAGDAEKAGGKLELLLTRCIDAGAPKAARLRKNATALGVPDNDVDLAAALQAAGQNQAATVKDSWAAVIRRSRAGEFGPNGFASLQQRLNQLTQDYEIPPEHAAFRRADDGITTNNPGKALMYLEQLEELVAADFFEER